MKKKKRFKTSKRSVRPSHEREIIEYLSREGIEKLTNKEVFRRFVSEASGSVDRKFRQLLGTLMQVKILNLDIPSAYDSLQCMRGNYDYRLGFLPQMIREIDAIDDAVVVDAGCATGLDLCYLAQHYQNTPRRFIGYDKQRKMELNLSK